MANFFHTVFQYHFVSQMTMFKLTNPPPPPPQHSGSYKTFTTSPTTIHPRTNPCTDPCTAQLARWPRSQSDPTQPIGNGTTWYCCFLLKERSRTAVPKTRLYQFCFSKSFVGTQSHCIEQILWITKIPNFRFEVTSTVSWVILRASLSCL